MASAVHPLDTEGLSSFFGSTRSSVKSARRFEYVLPVLFLEFLAVSLTKGVVPQMLINTFGVNTYMILGVMETFKGILAFLSCPMFGRLSDIFGRKHCLLITVIGTTFPVWMLAFTHNMYIFVILFALSGIFSSSFALVFAYIADCIDRKKRAPAYGLALACFGMSFTIGPLSGSYIAKTCGLSIVFLMSLFLVICDVGYIYFYLPETVDMNKEQTTATIDPAQLFMGVGTASPGGSSSSLSSMSSGGSHSALQNLTQRIRKGLDQLPNTWSTFETFRIFRLDPFLRHLALVVFIYYTSVWAFISTMVVYVTTHLHFDSYDLGWLLSGYGIATMFSEGVLVRIIVPWLGETLSIQCGLLAFSLNCVVIAFAQSKWMIFCSIFFNMISNLVFPSTSSLISKLVEASAQGEAQGALNGIRALTEGIGPLFFGTLMGLFKTHPLPGAPYLLAAIMSFWAFLHCYDLPPEPEVVSAKYYGHKAGELEAVGLLEATDDEGNCD